MRRYAVRQAKASPQFLHFTLDDRRMKNAALGAAKQRFVGGKIEWAKRPILRYRAMHHRQQRHEAGLVALAGNGDGKGGAVG